MVGSENTVAGPSSRESPGDATLRRVVPATLAGTWYEADRAQLTRELDAFLGRVPPKLLPEVCALVLPHAGYRYSGPTAAYGARLLQDRRYQRVVVMGPSHRLFLENEACVPDETHFATPLGELAVDQSMIRELKKHSMFVTIPRAHQAEHSVQIELPLLQHVLGSVQLVPIIVGRLDGATARRMAAVLRELIDADTLVVASSDFTHYGPSFDYVPFHKDVPENLRKLDMGAFEQIRAKNVEGFFQYVAETKATICGQSPIGVLLAMLPDQAEAHLLNYETSGHLMNDYSSSVSYLAIAFTGKWSRAAAAELPPTLELSSDDRRQLVALARAALKYAVENGRAPTAEEVDFTATPPLEVISGAFVTLRKRGELRGCIGEIQPTRPLYQAVMEQAANAALNDHRFAPVACEELADVTLEVSVLTPPRPIASAGEIVIGQHGVILRKNGRSAVFLPKVATEQGWGVEETLNHLSRKAGLPEAAWRDGASFEVFEAVVLSEDGA